MNLDHYLTNINIGTQCNEYNDVFNIALPSKSFFFTFRQLSHSKSMFRAKKNY